MFLRTPLLLQSQELAQEEQIKHMAAQQGHECVVKPYMSFVKPYDESSADIGKLSIYCVGKVS